MWVASTVLVQLKTVNAPDIYRVKEHLLTVENVILSPKLPR